MVEEFTRTGPYMELGSYPVWAQEMMHSTVKAKHKVVDHELFAMMKEAALPEPETNKFLVGGWPVIEQFPQFMAVNLCKVQYGRSRGEDMARKYLMRNIRVEQHHADLWTQWAAACGVDKKDLLDSAVPVETQALNHWCWHSCERSSLATSMAATNLAIEGATGEWSTLICSSDTYENSFPPELRKQATRWLRLHAQYDDTHPWEALEIICSLIGNRAEPKYVAYLAQCISNSYEYMALSLDRCMSHEPVAAH
ncbi:TenA family transcriptional regulator [Massilia glaciei]|uniref:TenA family transcriptional regulator n=1 Tax=Massilia glaciei TaxID=1524097 RepID=A0A2U2HJF7_9BURK|nr:iron-containing redox enzyme family protein [Massilia glaciei]PWF47613.1 TenA family transcriptional regulator [Massilia glaciei]